MVCSECGKELKTQAGLSSHLRTHQSLAPSNVIIAEAHVAAEAEATDVQIIPGPPPPATVEVREPRDLGRPAYHRAHSNIRSIKMLYPTCKDDEETGFKGCQDVPGAENTLWWKGCIAKGHDPYYRLSKRTEKRAVLNEVSPGRFQKTGEEEYYWYEEEPNLEQVQVTQRVSGSLYGFDPITWRRGNGRIYPQNHPTKPLKQFCEYYNCWKQSVVVRDAEFGNYCDETAAKRVKLDAKGKAIEAFNMEKLSEQLEATRVG